MQRAEQYLKWWRVVTGGLMLALLFVLSWYNRYAADDWFFIGKLRGIGPFELTEQWYLNYGGRWFSYYLESGLLWISNSDKMLFAFTMSINLIFYFSLRFCLSSLFQFIHISMDRLHFTVITVLLTLMVFLGPADPGESFLWLSSSVIYLMSCILLFLLLGAVMKSYRWPVIAFLCILITGTCEVYAPAIIALIALICHVKRKKVPNGFLMTFWPLALLLFGFALNAFSPGSIERSAIGLRTNILAESAWSFVQIGYGIFSLSGIIIMLIIVFAFPLMLIGNYVGKKSELVIKSLGMRGFLFSCLLQILILFPATYILREFPPDRVLILPILLFFAYTSVEAFALGTRLKYRFSPLILITHITLISLMLSYIIYMQATILPEYAKACDWRKRILSVGCYEGKDFILPPLPTAGLLYSAELTGDPDHFLNRHYQAGTDAACKVKVNFPEETGP